jgi:ring-1,2-phenylacetyl-CoA epoxidase subunit PaaE
VLAEEANSKFTLVYANRSFSTIMFREELEDLKNRYMNRLSIIHVLETDSQEIDLFTGRIDSNKCTALFSGWIDIDITDTVFICGPEPMMHSIVAALKAHGMNDEQIKFELFLSAQPGKLKKRQSAAASDTASSSTELTVTIDGTARVITILKENTVLEALLANDMDAPFACKAGVCSTCRCRIVKGEVDMASNHALEDHEVENGYALACQAYPVSDVLVIDYEH